MSVTLSKSEILNRVAGDKPSVPYFTALGKFIEQIAQTDATFHKSEVDKRVTYGSQVYDACMRSVARPEYASLCNHSLPDPKKISQEVANEVGGIDANTISEYDVQNAPAYSEKSGITREDYHRILSVMHSEFAKLVAGSK